MTSTAQRRGDSADRSLWASATILFGASVMGIVGVLEVLEGISAVSSDKVYVRGLNYTYAIDVTAWGWIHIVLGAVAVLISVGLFLEWPWARWAGIVVAVLGAVANFAFVPYYPVCPCSSSPSTAGDLGAVLPHQGWG